MKARISVQRCAEESINKFMKIKLPLAKIMKEDKIDPICGMKGHIKAHGHYFCSQHCVEKYEKENKIKSCPSVLLIKIFHGIKKGCILLV